MRIISKFTDYYDNVQGVMYDGDMIFHRQSSTICINDIIKLRVRMSLDKYIDVEYIGFCEKWYPVFISNELCNDKFKKQLVSEYGFTAIGKEYNPIYISYSPAKKYIDQIKKSERRHWFINDNIDSIQKFANYLETLDLFNQYESPILKLKSTSIRNKELTVNPILKNYNFQSVFDPYTAFQELVMWIGNKAVAEYPPQITDDIVLRDAKGFDNMSFKKYPTKRRK